MQRSPSLIALTLAVGVGMAMPAVLTAQADRPVVAVLNFDNNSIGKDRGDYDGLGKGVADLLITDLAANPSVRVVDRDRIQQLLAEQNMAKSGQVDPQSAVRLGKILGAQYMITGAFMNTGRGQMVLTARAINVETSAITNPQKVQATGDDALGLISQLSAKISSDMKLPAMQRRVGEASPAGAPAEGAKQVGDARPAKLDWKTALLYSKALEAQDNGHAKQATEYFSQVLQKFPDFGPAKERMQKLQSSGD